MQQLKSLYSKTFEDNDLSIQTVIDRYSSYNDLNEHNDLNEYNYINGKKINIILYRLPFAGSVGFPKIVPSISFDLCSSRNKKPDLCFIQQKAGNLFESMSIYWPPGCVPVKYVADHPIKDFLWRA